MSHRSFRWALAGVALALLAASCETERPAGAPGTHPKPSSPAPPGSSGSASSSSSSPAGVSFKSSGDPAFDAWRNQFAGKAGSAGHQKSTIVAVLDGLTP